MPCLLGDIILKPQHCFIKAHRVSSYTTSTQPGSSSTEFRIMYTKSCHPLSQPNLHAFQITPYLAWFSIIKHNNRYFKLDTNKKSSSSTLPKIGSKMRKIFFFLLYLEVDIKSKDFQIWISVSLLWTKFWAVCSYDAWDLFYYWDWVGSTQHLLN